MQKTIFIFLLSAALHLQAQELYVYTEPASNMPAHSFSPKLSAYYANSFGQKGVRQRYVPEIMFGLNKNWMVHLATSFSNMNASAARFETGYLYSKFRFLSYDEVHKHFRMALFGEAALSKNKYAVPEANLMDRSGAQLGVVATQLVNKLAVSASVSHLQMLDASRFDKTVYSPARNYQAMNYTFSAGYLVFPREYHDYRQTNFNIYSEFLAQQDLSTGSYYVDAAPAVQFIFNSVSKLNLGYRFQLAGNMQRMIRQSFLISYERAFLNAW
jgi:hypothetical protein